MMVRQTLEVVDLILERQQLLAVLWKCATSSVDAF